VIWLEKYDVSVQALHDQLDAEFTESDDDKLLKELLSKLDEYGSKFGRLNTVGTSVDLMSTQDHQYFKQPPNDDYVVDENGENRINKQDDGYEGDLHSSLGSMYMYKHDFVAALSHLKQAVRLYELAGDHHSIVMANTKYSLSTLNFRIGEYSTSASEYEEALDLFKQSYGDGTNPFSILAQWKGILDGLHPSMYDTTSSLGALLNGVGFSAGDNGANDASTEGPATSTSIPESSNQLLLDDKNSGAVDTTLKASEENDITKPIATSDDLSTKDIRQMKVTPTKNNKIVLPGGSTIDLQKFLQQNKSKDEL
jgi:tetratricopeptide (TPR) repeat protein